MITRAGYQACERSSHGFSLPAADSVRIGGASHLTGSRGLAAGRGGRGQRHVSQLSDRARWTEIDVAVLGPTATQIYRGLPTKPDGIRHVEPDRDIRPHRS